MDAIIWTWKKTLGCWRSLMKRVSVIVVIHRPPTAVTWLSLDQGPVYQVLLG